MQAMSEQLGRAAIDEPPTKAEAHAYLTSLINKTLRIHATDGRMFIGTFKCTDTVSLHVFVPICKHPFSYVASKPYIGSQRCPRCDI